MLSDTCEPGGHEFSLARIVPREMTMRATGYSARTTHPLTRYANAPLNDTFTRSLAQRQPIHDAFTPRTASSDTIRL